MISRLCSDLKATNRQLDIIKRLLALVQSSSGVDISDDDPADFLLGAEADALWLAESWQSNFNIKPPSISLMPIWFHSV